MKLKIMMRRASLLFFSLCCAVLFLCAQVAPASAHALAATTGMVRFVHAAVGVPTAGTNGVSPAQQSVNPPAQQGTTTPAQQGTMPTPVSATGANGALPAQQGTTPMTTPAVTTPAIAMGVAGAPGPVDVFVDGQPVATQLAYGAATNYLPVTAGAHTVQFSPAGKGANAAILQQQVTVAAGGTQTVAAIGGTATAPLALKVFTDTLTMANAMATANNNMVTMAQIRVYHLTNAMGTINIKFNNTTVVINLMQGKASLYHKMNPGATTMQVVAPETNAMQQVMMVNQAGQMQQVTMNLQANMVYSIFLVDAPTAMMQMPAANGTGTPAQPTQGATTNNGTVTSTAMPVMAGTAMNPAMPGMPQTGSDPRSAIEYWEVALLVLFLLSSGGVALRLTRHSL